jgi:hypothetical protein
MINRPPTKIELKLEDDLIEYEETIAYRKNLNLEILNNSDSFNNNFNNNVMMQEINFSSSNNQNQINNNNLINNFPYSNASPSNMIIKNDTSSSAITKQNIVSRFSHSEGVNDIGNSPLNDSSMR